MHIVVQREVNARQNICGMYRGGKTASLEGGLVSHLMGGNKSIMDHMEKTCGCFNVNGSKVDSKSLALFTWTQIV